MEPQEGHVASKAYWSMPTPKARYLLMLQNPITFISNRWTLGPHGARVSRLASTSWFPMSPWESWVTSGTCNQDRSLAMRTIVQEQAPTRARSLSSQVTAGTHFPVSTLNTERGR